MAKAKKSGNSVQISLTGGDPDAHDGSEDWDFRAAIATIEQQDGARFEITRIRPAELQGFVGELIPAEFSPETLRERFGPGKYRIRAKGSDNLYIAGGGSMTIAPTSSVRPVSAPTTGGPPQTDIATLMLQLDERRRIESQQSTDRWLRYAAVLGPIVGPIIQKMVGGNSMTDMLTAVTKLRELAPQPDNDRLDVFLKALEFADERGTPKGGSSWIDLARDVVGDLKPAVAGLISNRGVTPAAFVPSAHSTAISAPSAADAATAAPSGVDGDPMLKYLPWLRHTLAMLEVQARRSSNPSLYAEFVLDNLPEGLTAQMFYDALARADWWQLLSNFHQGLTPYQGWVDLFRQEAMSFAVRELGVTDTRAAQEQGMQES